MWTCVYPYIDVALPNPLDVPVEAVYNIPVIWVIQPDE